MSERMVGDDSVFFQGYYAAIADVEKALLGNHIDAIALTVALIKERLDKLKSGKK